MRERDKSRSEKEQGKEKSQDLAAEGRQRHSWRVWSAPCCWRKVFEARDERGVTGSDAEQWFLTSFRFVTVMKTDGIIWFELVSTTTSYVCVCVCEKVHPAQWSSFTAGAVHTLKFHRSPCHQLLTEFTESKALKLTNVTVSLCVYDNESSVKDTLSPQHNSALWRRTTTLQYRFDWHWHGFHY